MRGILIICIIANISADFDVIAKAFSINISPFSGIYANRVKSMASALKSTQRWWSCCIPSKIHIDQKCRKRSVCAESECAFFSLWFESEWKLGPCWSGPKSKEFLRYVQPDQTDVDPAKNLATSE